MSIVVHRANVTFTHSRLSGWISSTNWNRQYIRSSFATDSL